MFKRSETLLFLCSILLLILPGPVEAQFGREGSRGDWSDDAGGERDGSRGPSGGFPGRFGGRGGGFPGADRGGSRFRSGGGFPGGGPSVERMMGFLDRDRDGEITPSEFEMMPAPIREAIENTGIDVSESVSTEDIIRRSDRISEGMQNLRGGDDRNRDRERRSSRRGAPRRDEAKPKPRPKVTVDLPSAYIPFDANRDGQVALHEWDRVRIAEFLILDRNQDGFLTPRELVAAQSAGTTSLISAAPSVSNSAPVTAQVAPDTSSVSGASPANQDSAAASRAAEALRRRAGYVFGALDKNNDGKLTEAEWQQSQGTREKFEKAGVTLQFPVEKDVFANAYPAE